MYSLCENYVSVFVWLIKPNFKKKSIELAIDFSVKNKKQKTLVLWKMYSQPQFEMLQLRALIRTAGGAHAHMAHRLHHIPPHD